jgi:glucose-1-phosphate adenylyltransferase
MVGTGSIISGAHVRNSVIGPNVIISQGAYVEGCVVMPGVRIGEGAVVRNTVLDKFITIDSGAQLGVDVEGDRHRYTVSDSGIVVIGKGTKVSRL